MEKYTPIPFKPLFNDLWVFFLYGLISSFFLGSYSSQSASLEDLQAIIFEPFSIRAFLIISTSGFLLVCLAACLLGLDEGRAAANWAMRKLLVPISEVGLSAGFIILGMSAGIMAYFLIPGAALEGAREIVAVNARIAALVAFVVVPLYWMQRSLFATERRQRLLLTLIVLAYLALIHTALWFVEPLRFWIVSLVAGGLLLLAWSLARRAARVS
ncbi:TPA: hypothetical protein ACGJWA_005298 [Pseudomonas aeruginosa]|uniref:hypothetical protein n=1 Tax=Pseudomonas aeruginosa TaxID=287 RepID=UPI00053E751A|nr:hypothetical protein [Pseudomonas aeruginosa]HBO1238827.1 hypothetical protein [Pseudomonas aeruginosa]HBO1878446.1 hypothetical protein [Pseudomonas aeruginosa]HBO2083074.1 hypothetical protein [Pseudomonas aeruginosa]